jgi:hypothetical protein
MTGVYVSKYWERRIGNLTILTDSKQIQENTERIRRNSQK